MNGYLTEEVVVDYGDGLIDRREALRRLGLLGVATAVASTMLAACDAGGSPPATPSSPAATAAPPASPITFGGLRGYWASAPAPHGAVLIVHENRGLTDHFKALPNRFAGAGYAALAVDLLSAEGGTDRFTDQAEATAALNAAPPARFVSDMRSGLDELARRAPGAKAGAIGFCFGGQQVWSLLAAGEPRLYAAAPFYGPSQPDADLSGSPNANVLAVYAAQDDRVNATRDGAEAALTRAALNHEIVTYPDANHAFFNDTGPRYAPVAAAAAWQKVLDWFGRYLA